MILSDASRKINSALRWALTKLTVETQEIWKENLNTLTISLRSGSDSSHAKRAIICITNKKS